MTLAADLTALLADAASGLSDTVERLRGPARDWTIP